MGNIFFFNFEIEIMVMLQSFSNTVTDSFAILMTMLGEEYVMILILGFFYWCYDKELSRKIALSLASSMVFGTVIKGVVQRRRPYMDNEAIRCIRAAHPKDDLYSPAAQGYSFPSLHSTMSTSVYVTVAWNIWKVWIVFISIALPIMIGMSRIYLGVHYPTDVLAGWALGLANIFLFSFINERYGYRTGLLLILGLGSLGFIFCEDVEFYSTWGVTLGVLLGLIYEEKNVNFALAERWQSYIVRPIAGVLIFVALSSILKIPGALITNESLALFYRLFRYALSSFTIIGPYPLLFKKLGI